MPARRPLWFALLALGLFAAPPAGADATAEAPPWQVPWTRAALERLSSPDPAARDAAQVELWDAGLPVVPALLDLAASADEPEAAARARAVVAKIESGLRPQSARQAEPLVSTYLSATVGERLRVAENLARLPDRSAGVILRLWLQESEPLLHSHLFDLMRQSDPAGFARLLMTAGKGADAEALLSAAAEARGGRACRDYAALLAAGGSLKTRLSAADAAATPPRAIGWMHLADGNFAAATADALLAGDEPLHHAAQLAAGDWPALAAHYEAQAAASTHSFDDLALSACFHEAAWDRGARGRAVRRLLDHAAANPNEAYMAAEALFLCGAGEEGVGVLKTAAPSVAFELLCRQLRFDEAFALLDAGRAGPPPAPAEQASLRAAAAAQYRALGEHDKADALDGGEKRAPRGAGTLSDDALADLIRPGAPPAAALGLGHRFALARRWDAAAACYAWAAGPAGTEADGLFLLGWARSNGGDEAGGRRRMDVARLLALADAAQGRRLAAAEHRAARPDDADRQWDIVLRLGDPWAEDTALAARQAASAAAERGDFAAAALRLRRSMAPVVRTEVALDDSADWLRLPVLVKVWTALADAAAGREAAAEAALDEAASLLPGDTDWVVDAVNRLDQQGHKALGDRVYSQCLDRLRRVCERYPAAACYHQAAAALAGACGRQTDPHEGRRGAK